MRLWNDIIRFKFAVRRDIVDGKYDSDVISVPLCVYWQQQCIMSADRWSRSFILTASDGRRRPKNVVFVFYYCIYLMLFTSLNEWMNEWMNKYISSSSSSSTVG